MIENAGAYGWMQDFGEYAPMKNVLLNHSRERNNSDIDNYSNHNAYPLEYAKTFWELQ